jgi:hypothetical protein
VSTVDDDHGRYMRAAHAMQSGVAMKANYERSETEPKHLRVGVNSAMVAQGALAKLLIDAGVFTEEQYFAALADYMEQEAETYRKWLQERISPDGSTRISLG